jgi:hypothetical protein
MVKTLYYQSIVEITQDYLGPAAGRFVDRQIRSYLNKSPEEINRKDIPMLALRIRSGLVVLTHDKDTVEECFRRITAIADNSHTQIVTS